ncbi:MAG: hypothetical protein WBD67_08735, partial [Terracidiphilus sp.]
FKSRGYPDVIRYNHFGDGAARQLDMVDNQDAGAYTTFEGYLGQYRGHTYRGIYPRDRYTANFLASAVEAHHADYVYGNTFVNTTAGVPIHYSTDHGGLENDRLGTLWFYNNSFYEPAPLRHSYRWYMFDTSGGGGDSFPEIEWPQIQAFDNAIWMGSPTKPYFFWNKVITQFTTFGRNVINANWGTGNMAGGYGTGWWATGATGHAFQGAGNAADTTGVANLVGVNAAPFDLSTFAPNAVLINAGTSMPANAPDMPVRFEFGPSATPRLRTKPLTIGAMDAASASPAHATLRKTSEKEH